MYPIHVNLSGKTVIVAGGGLVAYRKIKDLLNEEAIITVISLAAVNEIQEWHFEQKLTWIEREVKRVDLEEAFLIIAATNSKETNSWIASHAKPNQLVNVADHMELGNFIVPSVVKRGKLVLSVSTSGASPILSKSIKKELQQTYSEDYETYLDFLFECRAIIKREFPQACRRSLLRELTDSRFLYDKEKQNVYKQALMNKVDRNLASKTTKE
ncbi:NAD(P)-dependent oxidoreductase [Fictibacillus sp. b24]|uniref:precorrin-2 dehydrogenase/sirohydrochlorin ferrochelatase family protein n=1 Tax=Fictibacillus sp. b24 TaxID=3055863 RepID=UPI00259FEF9E|nr:NAD(P)-dependent oxidoreductase [Fictibacillus sp. b24]MDM5316217.1 NAD(P)-dependent oxidoreductase [Fictibacillus sp. b24]